MFIETEKSPFGKVISYSSFEESYRGQKHRNKLDIRTDLEPFLSIIDEKMSEQFEWQWFGLNKVPKGVICVYEHKKTGNLIRISTVNMRLIGGDGEYLFLRDEEHRISDKICLKDINQDMIENTIDIFSEKISKLS